MRASPLSVHDTYRDHPTPPRRPPFPRRCGGPTAHAQLARPRRRRTGDHRVLPRRARLLEHRHARPSPERGSRGGPARRRPGGRGGGRRLARTSWRYPRPPRPHAPPVGSHCSRSGGRSGAGASHGRGRTGMERLRGGVGGRGRGPVRSRDALRSRHAGTTGAGAPTRRPAGSASCVWQAVPAVLRAGGREHAVELTRARPARRRPAPGRRAGDPMKRPTRRRRCPGIAPRRRGPTVCAVPGVTVVELDSWPHRAAPFSTRPFFRNTGDALPFVTRLPRETDARGTGGIAVAVARPRSRPPSWTASAAASARPSSSMVLNSGASKRADRAGPEGGDGPAGAAGPGGRPTGRAAQYVRPDPAATPPRRGCPPGSSTSSRSQRKSWPRSSTTPSRSASTSTSCRPTSARWRRAPSGSPAASRAARCRGTRSAPSWETATANT